VDTVADPGTLKIDFTDTDGGPRQWKVLGERELPPVPGSGMSLAELEMESEAGTCVLVQKAITREAQAADSGLYRRLENEVRIGLLLHRRFGGPAYPVELTRLVGYDVDRAEPFVLFERYRGPFVADVAGRLLLDEQRLFQTSLLRGVRVLEQAGVVHRGITPHSVRWDGHRAQLADFELAALAFRARRPEGARPWAAPQQRMGVGGTCARDDVWSAGMVIYHIAVGSSHALDRDPDLGLVEPRTRELLAGVFAQKAVHRAHPVELLRRLRAADPIPPADEVADRRFEDGGRRFDDMMRNKHGTAYRRPPEPADRVVVDEDEPEPATVRPEPVTGPMPQPPPQPPAWSRPGGGTGMVVTVLIILAIVALALWILGGLLDN
jgi:serine/threonine protein kinase